MVGNEIFNFLLLKLYFISVIKKFEYYFYCYIVFNYRIFENLLAFFERGIFKLLTKILISFKFLNIFIKFEFWF